MKMSYTKQAAVVVVLAIVLYGAYYAGTCKNNESAVPSGEAALEMYQELDAEETRIRTEKQKVAEAAKTEIGSKLDYYTGLKSRLEAEVK
jgi:preprotein translocase subunit SecF